MSHEILGQRFLNRGNKPAWHELGTQFPEDVFVLASEAAGRVAGDIVVSARPLFYESAQGITHPILDSRAIVREATYDDPVERVFGVTSDRWEDFSYTGLAGVLDPLSRELRVETAGLIKRGSVLFLCFQGPDFGVMGDPCQSYLTVNLSQMPKIAHETRVSTIRVVCSNTNDLSRRAAKLNLSIPHHANQAARLVLASELVKAYGKATETAKAIFERFAKTPITTESLSRFFEAVWKTPDMPVELRLLEKAIELGKEASFRGSLPAEWDEAKARESWETAKDRQDRIRAAGRYAFERFQPLELGGTVWAAYNAVTEVADWRNGANSALSSFSGIRYEEKQRAFSEAMVLAGVPEIGAAQ